MYIHNSTNMPHSPSHPGNLIYEWSDFLESPLWKSLKLEWKQLLENSTLKESFYHSFKKKHPALLLCSNGSHMAISKLKLGSDYETDFVVVEEGYSDGTMYELIEIESPHTKLFTSKGAPSAKLNLALQQIRDWRRFLKDNRTYFSKYLPTANTKN